MNIRKHCLLATTLLISTQLIAQEESRSLQYYENSGATLVWDQNIAMVMNVPKKSAWTIYQKENTFWPYEGFYNSDSKPTNPKDFYRGDYKMLSLVGPIFSFQSQGYAEGGAHPSYSTIWVAIDIRTRQPAELTSIFPADEILRALQADSIISKLPRRPGYPKTLAGFLDSLDGGCDYFISSHVLQKFAFHHIKGDQVAIRFGISHGCEVNRGKFTQIGIYLKIPPGLRAQLDLAAKQSYLANSVFLP